MLWNRGFVLEGLSGAYSLHWNSDEFGDGALSWCLYPEISVVTSVSQGKTTLSAVETANVGFAYNWVGVHDGDIVDEASTRACESWFLHGWIDWKEGYSVDGIGSSDYGISVPSSGEIPVYLGFATEYAPGDGTIEVVYGWVELFVRGKSLSLGRTAIDLSGSPVVAGQVPEPSAAALALFGAAVLARRRKRRRQARPDSFRQ